MVWLNDAHHYFLHDVYGEAIVAGLRLLLADATRAPVLVAGTLWAGADHYDRLRTVVPRDCGLPDPHAQARVLLAGRCLGVSDAFTPAEIRQARRSADARLVTAAAAADGRICQYLAADFDLLHLYNTATPGPRALLDAAIDARRLDHLPALPLDFLAAAAEGYLTDTQWDLLEDTWLPQALTQLTRPLQGARGHLHPQRRPRGAFTEPLTGPASSTSSPTSSPTMAAPSDASALFHHCCGRQPCATATPNQPGNSPLPQPAATCSTPLAACGPKRMPPATSPSPTGLTSGQLQEALRTAGTRKAAALLNERIAAHGDLADEPREEELYRYYEELERRRAEHPYSWDLDGQYATPFTSSESEESENLARIRL